MEQALVNLICGDKQTRIEVVQEWGVKEIEAKYRVQDAEEFGAIVAVLEAEGWVVAESGTEEVLDRYFDTRDWRLFRSGWAYRWRESAAGKRVGLKALTMRDGPIQHREEQELDVPAFPGSSSQFPSRALGDLLRALLRGHEPQELFRVEKMRRVVIARSATGTLIECALDDTLITAPGRRGRAGSERSFLEIELELQDGSLEEFLDLTKRLEKAVPLVASPASKFEEGLSIAGLQPPGWPWGKARAGADITYMEENQDENL